MTHFERLVQTAGRNMEDFARWIADCIDCEYCPIYLYCKEHEELKSCVERVLFWLNSEVEE